MSRRERERQSGSQRLAQRPEPFLAGQVSLPHAGSRLALGGAFDGQKTLPLPQQVEDPVGLFCSSVTGALLHGLAMVPHGVAVHQTDRIPTACAPFVEGVPGETSGCHGDQEPLTPGVTPRMPERLCKAPATRPGVGKRQRVTAYDGLRAETGMVFGFPHIDANA